MRLHIAFGARIGVVVPGAADPARLVEQDEIVDAGLLELHAHAQPAAARADDDDMMV